MALHSFSTAAIVTKPVIYTDGDVTLEGYAAYDDAAKENRPGVLIVHQWTGLTEYEKGRAELLASMGYVAFACDIYGQGIRPEAGDASGKEAGKYKGNRALFRQRLNKGLETLKGLPHVDVAPRGDRLLLRRHGCAGTGASGADVKGVVSYHGGLDSPTPADGAHIEGEGPRLPRRRRSLRSGSRYRRLPEGTPRRQGGLADGLLRQRGALLHGEEGGRASSPAPSTTRKPTSDLGPP